MHACVYVLQENGKWRIKGVESKVWNQRCGIKGVESKDVESKDVESKNTIEAYGGR